MRCSIISFMLLFGSISVAGLKIDAAYKMSETRLKAVGGMKAEERRKEVLRLKTELDETLNAWEKENPKDASKDEEAVSLFFYTLSPVFELAEKEKKSEKDCSNAELAIRAAGGQGKPEGVPLTKNSKIALDWVLALCK